MQTKLYTPNHNSSVLQLCKAILLGFVEGRELGYRLFIRDLKSSYQKSFLGILWLFLPALATAGIWIFLNNQNVVSIMDTPMNYAAFTMCGTLLWSLFAEAIAKPMQRYQSAMSMMSKLNFPREALLLTSLYDMLFSLLLKLVILIPILWLLGYPPNVYFLLALVWIFVLIIMGLSIGVILSPLGLLYTDIGKGITLLLPFLMYLTPVIYPIRKTGLLSELQFLNPVTPFLERARSYMGGYEFLMGTNLWIWSIITLSMLFIGLLAIRIAMPIIVERSGS